MLGYSCLCGGLISMLESRAKVTTNILLQQVCSQKSRYMQVYGWQRPQGYSTEDVMRQGDTGPTVQSMQSRLVQMTRAELRERSRQVAGSTSRTRAMGRRIRTLERSCPSVQFRRRVTLGVHSLCRNEKKVVISNNKRFNLYIIQGRRGVND